MDYSDKRIVYALILGAICFTSYLFHGIRDKIALKNYNEKIVPAAHQAYNEYINTVYPDGVKKYIYRDSLLVRNYLKEYYLRRETFLTIKGSTDVEIGDIFYSPDSLKMIVFGARKHKKYKKTSRHVEKDGYSRDGTVFIGVRDKKDEIWDIHPDQKTLTAISHNSFEEIFDYLRINFFTDRIHRFTVLHVSSDSDLAANYLTTKGRKGSVYLCIRYIISDPRFWDDALFIKDYEVEGYYNFQTMYSDRKMIYNTQPWLVTPDSIRAMYKTEE